MKGIGTIILDFDGVLVESVGIKDRAFKEIFSDYPEHVEEIMQYHLSHNAVIRFEKFKYIFENILGIDYTEEIEQDLSERYSQLVVDDIINCPSVAGSVEFLDYFYKRVPIYVVSVNPKDELDKIIKERGLSGYFKDVYPVPWKKPDAIRDILKREGIGSDQAVFIGDSPEDYKSAMQTGVHFMGRFSGKDFGIVDFSIFRDFFEIKSFILHNSTLLNSEKCTNQQG